MNLGTFSSIFENTRQMLGSGSAVIWYRAGRSAGEFEGKRLKRLMTRMGTKDLVDLVGDIYTNMGWGKHTFELNIENRSMTLRMKNNPIVRGIKSKEPVCHFIRGFYEGFCPVIFDTEKASTRETMCQAMGNDHCEFGISW